MAICAVRNIYVSSQTHSIGSSDRVGVEIELINQPFINNIYEITNPSKKKKE